MSKYQDVNLLWGIAIGTFLTFIAMVIYYGRYDVFAKKVPNDENRFIVDYETVRYEMIEVKTDFVIVKNKNEEPNK